MPRPDFDTRFLSGGDAAFEEGFRQTLGAAGGAEQNEGLSGRLLEGPAELFQIPAILRGGARADMNRRCVGGNFEEVGSFGSAQIGPDDVWIHEGLESSCHLGILGVQFGVEGGLDVERALHFKQGGVWVDHDQPVGRKDLWNGEAHPPRGHAEGKERDFLDFVTPPLGRRIELAKAVDPVAEKLYPQRPEPARWKDVKSFFSSEARRLGQAWFGGSGS